jgi:purine-binding chemotaxis protein CheW
MKKSSAQGSEDPILQWVTFRLDNESYGINVMQVQEVLRYTEIAPVPGAPSYVLGIINLRGNVVTVIDTRQRFGLMPRNQRQHPYRHHRSRQASGRHHGRQRGRSGLPASVGNRDRAERR